MAILKLCANLKSDLSTWKVDASRALCRHSCGNLLMTLQSQISLALSLSRPHRSGLCSCVVAALTLGLGRGRSLSGLTCRLEERVCRYNCARCAQAAIRATGTSLVGICCSTRGRAPTIVSILVALTCVAQYGNSERFSITTAQTLAPRLWFKTHLIETSASMRVVWQKQPLLLQLAACVAILLARSHLCALNLHTRSLVTARTCCLILSPL